MRAPGSADQEFVCGVVASCRDRWYEGKQASFEFGGLFIAMPLDGRSACLEEGRNERGSDGQPRAAKSLQVFESVAVGVVLV